MSRLYSMGITIKDFDIDKSEEIISSIIKEWNIQHKSFDPSRCDCDAASQRLPLQFKTDGSLRCFVSPKPSATIFTYGEGYLCGGETEEQFVDRLAISVWKANNNYCHVEVEATYLDDLPYETHVRNREDYIHERNKRC